MEVNNSYKKNLITLGVLSCFIGYAHEALSYPLINDQINTNTRYSNSDLYIDTNHQIVGVTLADKSTLLMNGGSQASDTVVEGHSFIHLYRYDEQTVGNPIIQDTTVNEYGNVHMGAGSLSFGQLFIGKDASLDIDNNQMGLTDVSVNIPVPAANVTIENLTLVGTAAIAPRWPSYQGEDGDAPLPVKPGPALITRIDNLNMQSGSKLSMTPYISGVQFNRLELKNLSGEGDFYLTTSLADGLGDKIYVSDHASGNFGLQVKDSGREVKNPQNVQLVYINSGDARFNLLNNGGVVETGIWQYKLYSKTDNGHTEWYLAGGQPGALPPPETNLPPDTNTETPEEGNNTTSNPKLSNSARAVINLATAPRHILEAESSTLRQRMGDLRRNDGDVGVWARYLSDNSHFNDKGYSAYRTNLNGMQIGADKKLSINNGALLFGAFTSYSKSNIKSDNTNNGDIRSHSGGVYATWLDNSGFYIDTLLKANHLNNEVRTNMNGGQRVKGNYSQNTLTASTEVGYTIRLTEAFKLTPYGKVAYSRLGKADYVLDNGMEANLHATNSVQGEVGTLLESEFRVVGRSVRPYVKAAMSREFIKHHAIEINKTSFDSDYSGNAGKYGLGVAADVADNASIYTEVSYQKGNKVETPIYATAGFRVSF